MILIISTNILGLLLALQLPSVQTRLAQYLSAELSEKTGFNITVTYVEIDWLDKATLSGLTILDNHQQLMIDVADLTLDYKLSTLFRKKDVLIDEIILNDPIVNLISDTDSLLNITVFIDALKSLSTPSETGPGIFTIDRISITRGLFSFNTSYKDSISGRFDHNHFILTDLESSIKNFSIRQDTINLVINQLTAADSITQLVVHDMQTNFEISQSRMVFDQLDLKVGKSRIKDSIVFNYNRMKSLSYFNDSVRMSGNLNGTMLHSEDLAVFAPYFSRINENYRVSGSFEGEVSALSVQKLELNFGKGSRLAGTAYFSGLPDIENTFMNIQLSKSILFENDLNQYVNVASFSEYNRFNQLTLDGSFTGYIHDFVATGKFNSSLGFMQTDINLKVAEDPANTAYQGQIRLDNFELGSYLNDANVGKISLNGRISGRGFDVSNADFVLDGEISELEINKYAYSNIKVNAQFASEFFEGLLSVDDPNLKLQSESFVDLRQNRNEVKVTGELEYANFQALNILEEKSSLSSKIDMSITGFEIDSIIGHVFLEDLQASYKEETIKVDRLLLNSDKQGDLRTLELVTDRVNIKVNGNFNYTTAYADLKRLMYEYQLNLLNTSDSITSYYANLKPGVPEKYYIDINCELRDINRLINLFIPDLHFASNTKLTGNFRHGYSSIFALNLTSDSISYTQNSLINNELNFHTSKLANSEQVLAAMDFVSGSQSTESGATADEFIVSAIWDNNKIDFNAMMEQKEFNNVADLYGEIYFLKDTTNISFKPSNLRVLDKLWTIKENNQIILTNKEIIVSDLSVFNEDEELRAEGIISRDPSKEFNVSARNLEIALINPLINKRLDGVINGDFSVADVYNLPIIQSDFSIQDFRINDFLVGNVNNYSKWNNQNDLFDVNFYIEKDELRAVNLSGTYNPFNEQQSLDLSATLTNAELAVAEPFIGNIFSEIAGSISGEFKVLGTLLNPMLAGKGEFNNAQLKVNYLNTLYRFNGQWSLDSSAIRLINLAVTDIYNNSAQLSGVFNHTGFRDFNMNINGKLQKFMVLNTTVADNDLFYGTGFTTGDFNISGTLRNINISATAVTDKGTKFYIPVGGSSEVGASDFITFVNFADTVNQVVKTDIKERLRLSGISLNFDLEITPDAYTELIFDQTVGDIIRGTGQGNLSLAIDTKGEFTMFGSYEFVTGGYNFTMYNIINKEFVIEPKSKIVWAGNPYEGNLDMNATYEVVTSLAPLIDSAYSELPDVKRNYPVKVNLNLKGPLLSPDIEFAIVIDEYPRSNVDMDTEIRAFLNKIETDEQELNRQVFSLLVLRNFSSPNSFETGGTLGSSVSEFISNQLSYWISQVDDNLTIDIDLGKFDENALNTFQLRVSYAFLDGKLVVTRDGGFTEPNSEATVSSIVGDWNIEYLLAASGKLRVKLFKKTNYNQLNSSLTSTNQSIIAGGFSLIYTTSFNSVRDVFNKKKKKNNNKNKQNTNSKDSAILTPKEEPSDNTPEIR